MGGSPIVQTTGSFISFMVTSTSTSQMHISTIIIIIIMLASLVCFAIYLLRVYGVNTVLCCACCTFSYLCICHCYNYCPSSTVRQREHVNTLTSMLDNLDRYRKKENRSRPWRAFALNELPARFPGTWTRGDDQAGCSSLVWSRFPYNGTKKKGSKIVDLREGREKCGEQTKIAASAGQFDFAA